MTQKYCVCPGTHKLYCVVRLIGLSGQGYTHTCPILGGILFRVSSALDGECLSR